MPISKNLSQEKGLMLPRVLPFAIFMAFIAIQEGVQILETYGIVGISDIWLLLLYPAKTVAVGMALYWCRRSYSEIAYRDLSRRCQTASAICVGILVFFLWINMGWSWATIGTPKGFNPMVVSDNFTRSILIGFRLFGSSVIVPIMEELFWRSWLSRYLISTEFQSVNIGKFTVPSFLIANILFGLEHNLWFAGIVAGALYSLLLYRTKSIMQCILAHGITNFMLGIYVIRTGSWEYW